MPWENRRPRRGNRTATVHRRRTVHNRRTARRKSCAASHPTPPSSTTTSLYSTAIFVPLNPPNKCATRRPRQPAGHRREMVSAITFFSCCALKIKNCNPETFTAQVNLVPLRYTHQRALLLRPMAINWRTIAPNSLMRISFRNAITVWRTIRMSDQVYCRLRYHPPDPVKHCSIHRKALILPRAARTISTNPNNEGRTRWTYVTISAQHNAATRSRWADLDLGTSWDTRIHPKAVTTAHRHASRAVRYLNYMFFILFLNSSYFSDFSSIYISIIYSFFIK